MFIGYHELIMPSWNIHTAHAERLLDEAQQSDLGLAHADAFLFGNYVPDIYVGFMVPDASFRVDYCLTHCARPNITPAPDADRFWDECVARRAPDADAGLSLALGAWAHLVADRVYNLSFREFCRTHDVPQGEELRKQKQADFDAFGHTLRISRHVTVTPDLLAAALAFRPYSVLADDVERAIRVADRIVDEKPQANGGRRFRLLDEEWLSGVFATCHEQLSRWLQAWRELAGEKRDCTSESVRRHAGLPEIPHEAREA